MKKISTLLPLIKKKESLTRLSQFVELSGNLKEQNVEEAKALGFMSRLLVMVNLPYRDPGDDARVWIKNNGSVSLIVAPAYDKHGKSLGLPYGSYPRLILAYLITQAVKTQSPVINLGKSFADFLKLLSIKKGGTTYPNFQKQLKRTLSASFAWSYENEKQWSRENIQVSHQARMWWDTKKQNQEVINESCIKLNSDFYNEIIRNAVPLDFRIVKVLKNSPLGLDLYMFLCWRTFNLKKPLYLSWATLHEQVGGQYSCLKEFARDCRKHFSRINAIWPELNIKITKGKLCISSSSPLISPVEKRKK